MGFLFEKLDVYKTAVEFAGRIQVVARDFPRGSFAIADQLRRASLSIPANIAEGSGRVHKADKRKFYVIARGSAYECVPLLRVGIDAEALDAEQYEELRHQLKRVVQMLTRLEQAVSSRTR